MLCVRRTNGLVARRAATFGFRIFGEALQTINKVCSVERIAYSACVCNDNRKNKTERRTANAHTGGLTETGGRCLSDRLVRQCARARHHANFARQMNVAGHDANFALARLDDALQRDTTVASTICVQLLLTYRTIGPDQATGRLRLEHVLDTHHVFLRNALGDAHDQRNLSRNGLFDGRCGTGRRHVDHRCVGLRFLDGWRIAGIEMLVERNETETQERNDEPSATDANTGRPKCSVPAFLGLMPPTCTRKRRN